MHTIKDTGNSHGLPDRFYTSENGDLISHSYSSGFSENPPVHGTWNGYTFSWNDPGDGKVNPRENIQITIKPGKPATVSGSVTITRREDAEGKEVEKLIFVNIPYKTYNRSKLNSEYNEMSFEIICDGPSERYIPEYSVVETINRLNGWKYFESIRILSKSKVNIKVSFIGQRL